MLILFPFLCFECLRLGSGAIERKLYHNFVFALDKRKNIANNELYMRKVLQKGKFALSLSRGFTLIELLIVIGILGILVTAVLLTLNPAEAQKKTRDAKRMKDLASLQSVVDQYVNSGVALTATTRKSDDNSASQACGVGGWLGVNLCAYANSIPIDPVNQGTRATSAACGAAAVNQTPLYRVEIEADGDYEINVVQESTANCRNVDNANDGGNDNTRAEVGTVLTIDP